jgi:hypothetical protein
MRTALPQIGPWTAGPRVDLLGARHYAAQMRRGVPTGPESSPDREPSRALTLRHSPARQRLSTLEREHERLLREIRKKKLARDASEDTARDAARAFDARLGPLREALCAATREMQAMLASLLGAGSRLNRRDKARVRRAYGHLLSERDAADESSSADEEHEPHAGAGARRPSPQGDAGYSAPKPKDQGPCLLRSLFRKLALALHPDKEQDPAQRATLTSVMKEVTRAYEIGDVARLVELERSWLAAPVPCEHEADLERNTQLLLQANQELRRQLRALSAELKSLRDSVLALGPLRGTRSKGAGDGAQEWLLAELERELLEMQVLRDFARSFLSGDVSLSEFLLGPPSLLDDHFDRVEQFLGDTFRSGPCGGGRRPR